MRSDDPALPRRTKLPHEPPTWVSENAIYFVTVCTVPRGANQLCRPSVGGRLIEAALYRERVLSQWSVHLLLLMPDHVHMLLSVAGPIELARCVTGWKRYTACRLGVRWQRDFFEHRLRRDESLEQKADYILHNPVRAGLTSEPDGWPYVWQNLRRLTGG